MSRLIKIAARLSILGYASLLCLILFANLDLLNTNWPFELFSSYMRHVLLLLPFIISLAVWRWRITLLPLIGLALFAFWPLLSFSKYVTPTHKDCVPEQTCINILSANLQGNIDALNKTAQSAAGQNADLVTLLEIPKPLSPAQLQHAFPALPYMILLSKHQDGSTRRMRLAVLSRYPLGPEATAHPKAAHDISGPRFISTFLHVPNQEPIQIIALHPYPPMSPPMAWGRDQTLSEAITSKHTTENFIMLGDFNTTPWTPAFKALPGRRAGDPRFVSTWDSRRPWLGIPIDHILVGDAITVLKADTQPATKSDHFPISATVALK